MKTVVTGGAGFLGSHLVDRLVAEGHQVDVIDDLSSGSLANLADARGARTGRLRFHQLDITDPSVAEVIDRREPEVVFHLAAPPPLDDGAADDLAREAEIIVVGTLRVLDAARAAGARKVVAASSAAIYRPPDGSELPVRESHPCEPATHHGVAKKAMGDLLSLYRERHAVEFTALALATVYGPRQQRGPVPAAIRDVVSGEPCGGAVRSASDDLVFVDDVVDAFVRAGDRGSGLVVNVGTGVETTADELRAAVAAAAGSDGLPARGSAGARGARWALDPGRSRIHLGWAPWTTLADGIAQTVAASEAET